jgi:PPOX class probable F420-dependent enzyme
MNKQSPAGLAEAKYINLVTYRRNGSGVTTPVWFALGEELLYVGTFAHTWKVRRVRADSAVRFIPCNGSGSRNYGDWYEGTAHVATEPERIAAAQRLLREKYGWQYLVAMLVTWARGWYERRVVLEVAYGEAETP